MKKLLLTNIMLSLFFMSSCTYRYHSSILGVEKTTCFGKNSVQPYFRSDLTPKENSHINVALDKANNIFMTGMFPFFFEDDYNESRRLDCGVYKPRADILSFVSLSSNKVDNQSSKSQEIKDLTVNISCKDTEHIEKTFEFSMKKKLVDIASPTILPEGRKEVKPVDTFSKTKIKLTVSSYLYTLNPADRLERVYTLIFPLDDNIKFAEAGTPMFESVLFGKETDKSDLSLSASVGKITPSASFTKTLERNIAKKYAILNSEIFPMRNIMLISQDGGPANAEIRGNVYVEAVITHPSDNNIVHALVASVAVVRRVISGGETIKEDDDEIKYVVFRSVVITRLW